MGKYIRILTTPPGPKAKEIIKRDEELLMQSYVRWYPFVVAGGEGAIVEDIDGNRYIDFNSGLAVLNTGHLHPKVIEAVELQLKKYIHYSLTDFYYELAVEYAEKLFSALPWKDNKIFYTNSGAESIEAIIKVAKGYFEGKRNYFIGFLGAFHGRTIGSLSFTASKAIQRKFFFPLMPGVIHVPYPYPYRCPFNSKTPKECAENVLGYIEEWIFKKYVDPGEVAAFLIEPVQGEGGYVVPPKEFMTGLKKLAEKHGILFAVDEVQSGMGRTGKLLAIEHFGVRPDLAAFAKGIASGFPLGALVGRRDVMTLPGGSHANTFGGNPVSLAAAKATLDLLTSGLMDNAKILGEYIMKRFTEYMEKYEIIGDVRGLGLMIGVELVRDRKTKEPASKELSTIINNCFKRGVLVIGAGASSIRIAPPLVITREQVDEALEIIEDEIRKADKSLRS